MTVAEFKEKAYGIYSITFYHKGKFYTDKGQFDNYIITEFNFEVGYGETIGCTLDVVEPQK